MNERHLHVERQAGRDAVRIDLVGRQSLGLEKDLVRRLVGEARDLVLDGRAVARPDTFDDPGEHRRTVETTPNDFVGPLVGMGDPARPLFGVLGGGSHEREHGHRRVAGLLGHHGEIDAAPVEPRWRSRLQASYRQLQLAQPVRQRHGCRVTGATGLVVGQPDVDQTRQERPGRKDDGVALEHESRAG